MVVDVFAVPVFFVVFREAFEVAVVVSVLFAFLKQTLVDTGHDPKVYKRLVWQVWLGVGIGVFICMCIGAGIIATFYRVGVDKFASAEYNWEGSFAIIASVIITVLGFAMLRVSKMKEKWAIKLSRALDSRIEKSGGRRGAFKLWVEKYIMFTLPFVTTMREGIEAIIFIAGVSFSSPASSVPLPVIVGLVAGGVIGYILYVGGSSAKLQYFLVVSTCLFYLVAASLFSRGVWYLEAQKWNDIVGGDATELGEGPGSYDISKSVWHVNCCSPGLNGGGGWGIFNAILGWQNSATYGSVISYNVYWIFVIVAFLVVRYNEVTGHWPLLKPAKTVFPKSQVGNDGDGVINAEEGQEKTTERVYASSSPAASK